MGIVSSSYVMDGHAQTDGSRYVKETHVDSQGRVMHSLYKLQAGQGDTEAQARLDANATYLNAQLAEQEADEILNGA